MKSKILLLFGALLALLCGSCEGQQSGVEGDDTQLEGAISIITDRNIIRTNGSDYATLTILLTDSQGVIHDISSEAEIYCGEDTTPLATPTFATTTEGSYEFYALYGFEVSNSVNIKAVDGIADIPADPHPASTDFTHRMLLIQHTGTGCPNCPQLMSILKALSEDSAYASRYHHVASHSYSTLEEGDKAYSSAATLLSRTVNPGRIYPWLTFNLTDEYAHESDDIKAAIDRLHLPTAEVAIAASATLIDGSVYTNISVKAAKSNQYRVALWLLEDSIASTQSSATASWQNIHNNCLREMVGENRTERIYGSNFGTIEQGKSLEQIIECPVATDWRADNCEMLIIVSKSDGYGNFELVNCALCPVGSNIEFAYN